MSSELPAQPRNAHEWLARYMMHEGMWNTPPILLENIGGLIPFPSEWPLASPYHLLEGHPRLVFVNYLHPEHDVWVVRVRGA